MVCPAAITNHVISLLKRRAILTHSSSPAAVITTLTVNIRVPHRIRTPQQLQITIMTIAKSVAGLGKPRPPSLW